LKVKKAIIINKDLAQPEYTRARRENGENVNLISEHRLHGLQLGRAMDLVDRLRTSADEPVLSGRRAVVIA